MREYGYLVEEVEGEHADTVSATRFSQEALFEYLQEHARDTSADKPRRFLVYRLGDCILDFS